MVVKLNHDAVSHARGLIRSGGVVRDERDAWSEDAPSADDGNAFIEKHGMAEYAKWYLAEDTEKTDGTKGRYLFPYGDFAKVHRCALISGESRAGQYSYASVEKAIKDLLESVDLKR
ncbi:MAG: hypothetical protein ABIO06_02070 [Pseudolysinimonas sp.]